MRHIKEGRCIVIPLLSYMVPVAQSCSESWHIWWEYCVCTMGPMPLEWGGWQLPKVIFPYVGLTTFNLLQSGIGQGKCQAVYHFITALGNGCVSEGALRRHFSRWLRSSSGKCGKCHPAIETSQQHQFRLTVMKAMRTPTIIFLWAHTFAVRPYGWGWRQPSWLFLSMNVWTDILRECQ